MAIYFAVQRCSPGRLPSCGMFTGPLSGAHADALLWVGRLKCKGTHPSLPGHRTVPARAGQQAPCPRVRQPRRVPFYTYGMHNQICESATSVTV